MSRSRKKPYGSITVSGSKAGAQKEWKQSYNRKMRRQCPTDEIPDKKKYGNIYSSPSDGKYYYGDDPKYTRK